MQITYDPEVDVLRIVFREVPIEESDEEYGIITDYDRDGSIVGIEVLNASRRVDDLSTITYDVLRREPPTAP
jgi:uncharacterized protein YuzE